MGFKTYANEVQKVNQPAQDSTSTDKYPRLLEKLKHFIVKKWLTFQENLKSMHLTESKQIGLSMKTKVNANTNAEENPKMTEQTKEKRQRSLV